MSAEQMQIEEISQFGDDYLKGIGFTEGECYYLGCKEEGSETVFYRVIVRDECVVQSFNAPLIKDIETLLTDSFQEASDKIVVGISELLEYAANALTVSEECSNMTAWEYLKELHKLCQFQTREGKLYGPASNSELKRWLQNGAVVVNGNKIKWDEKMPSKIDSLILFPKKGRITFV